jgi:hypothetical protein
MVTATSELTMITESLLWAIRKAATPGTLAPEYRPATRDAVKFVRQAYRAVMAIEARAELARLMQQAAQRPDRLRGIPQPDDTRVIMGRSHVGD